MANTARLVDALGPARVRDLLLTGRLVDADEARALGLATKVCTADRLAGETRSLAAELATRAPSTIAATKAMLQRLRDHRRPPAGSGDDIVAACYASPEFREGVQSFLENRKAAWAIDHRGRPPVP
jgi:enoyl-CoA hydratase/carnithine racemase